MLDYGAFYSCDLFHIMELFFPVLSLTIWRCVFSSDLCYVMELHTRLANEEKNVLRHLQKKVFQTSTLALWNISLVVLLHKELHLVFMVPSCVPLSCKIILVGL